MKKTYDLPCNIAQSLNLIGDKWTLLILQAIRNGCHSYSALQSTLKGISTNLLSKRLKELCRSDMLNCKLYSDHPPRYEYNLSKKSADLQDVFNAILLWGDRHLDKSYRCLTHHGSPVKIIYINEDTGEVIPPEELVVVAKKK